jgi:hydrogenase expression/formation protein HypE
MTELQAIGKVTPETFNELVRCSGVESDSVLVAPRSGIGAGIVEVSGKAVSFTTGPMFIVPEFGLERAAWFAVHLLASDSATSGLTPKYLSIDLSLPVETTEEDLSTLWQSMCLESQRLGISIVSSHMARYPRCRYPMVGAATLSGVGDLEKYVSPLFIRPGDKIIITKGPAIEAAGIFAAIFPRHIEKSLGRDTARKANDIFYMMSVVADASIAVTSGVREDGVSAMYNASEGGIWGGLYDMADAAQLSIKLDQDRIVLEPGVTEVCRLFGVDPYTSMSGGALIIACRPHKAETVLRLLHDSGIRSSIVGEFTAQDEGMVLMRRGNPRPFVRPVSDPFWPAFYDALDRFDKGMSG